MEFSGNLASSFAIISSKRCEQFWSSMITFILRHIFGIPAWILGFLWAAHKKTGLFYEPTLLTFCRG